jgi:hypothetical protein
MTQSRYRVHIYAVVRVEFEATAETFEDAAEVVVKDPATHERLQAIKGDDYAYAEDYQAEVVVDRLDEAGQVIDHDTVDVSQIDPSA